MTPHDFAVLELQRMFRRDDRKEHGFLRYRRRYERIRQLRLAGNPAGWR